ncbi:MAG TPA: hypothetical protein VF021_04565 [Longimicrobiales bacterium]
MALQPRAALARRAARRPILPGMYEELELSHILDTLRALHARISERFPGSGLSQVCAELVRIAEGTGATLERIRRPHRTIQVVVVLAVVAIVALTAGLLYFVARQTVDVRGMGSLLQTIESAAQDVIFFSLAIYFLLTLETRLDRKVALRELHRLRSIVHIVDMHQLTKDPEHLLTPEATTKSSPERKFTSFEMSRYLDYCAEMLSLASKLAALHVQSVNDPVVLSAVNDVETLAANLSNKIWQKIVVVDAARRAEAVATR